MSNHSSILRMPVVVALILLSGNANAEGIEGFQKFLFGMTLEEAQAIEPLTTHSKEDKGEWFITEDQINVLGNSYNQILLFGPDRVLMQINLTREIAVSDETCTREFSNVYGPLSSRYGEPDQPFERKDFNGIAFLTSAFFTEQDGSSVKLSSNWIANECYINVAYIASPGGVGF